MTFQLAAEECFKVYSSHVKFGNFLKQKMVSWSRTDVEFYSLLEFLGINIAVYLLVCERFCLEWCDWITDSYSMPYALVRLERVFCRNRHSLKFHTGPSKVVMWHSWPGITPGRRMQKYVTSHLRQLLQMKIMDNWYIWTTAQEMIWAVSLRHHRRM